VITTSLAVSISKSVSSFERGTKRRNSPALGAIKNFPLAAASEVQKLDSTRTGPLLAKVIKRDAVPALVEAGSVLDDVFAFISFGLRSFPKKSIKIFIFLIFRKNYRPVTL
jgi:hypothetical protein